MNTIVIEHADNETTAMLKQMAKVLGLTISTKKEKGTITNSKILDAIEAYETGKTKGKSKTYTSSELKVEFDKFSKIA